MMRTFVKAFARVLFFEADSTSKQGEEQAVNFETTTTSTSPLRTRSVRIILLCITMDK
jgi:hypothetical protein